ncbi:MAG: excisionase family DNA-binding protein [Candidatus Omnitrophica bacterium]|nr:excisionase family DNA-binding protein [Candidatus Omnitrophota bacterium]
MDKRYIDIKEASGYLGIQVSTIYSWTHQKQIPYIKMGRLLKFDLLDLDKWVLTKRVVNEEIDGDIS